MRTVIASVVVLVALAAPAPVGAQEGGSGGGGPRVVTHVEAMMRMRQGQEAERRGDLNEAVRLYREAAELGAPAEVFRALARTLERATRLREAAGAWTRFAALALRDDDRAAALERREALRRTVAVIRVRVVPARAGRRARVWIDRDAPRWYVAGGLEAAAEGGVHRVRVEAEGYRPWETRFPTAFGEPVEIVAALEPLSPAP